MLCPLNGGELQQRVGQDRKQHAQVLAHGLGPAGQVDDEGVVAQAGGGARERRERFDLERLAQQQLGDARRLRGASAGRRVLRARAGALGGGKAGGCRAVAGGARWGEAPWAAPCHSRLRPGLRRLPTHARTHARAHART